jgi:hypothetical protein
VLVPQDEDRRLTRHAADLSVNELVGDYIANYDNAFPRKAIHNIRQVLHALTSAFCRTIKAAARSKTSSGVIAVMQR